MKNNKLISVLLALLVCLSMVVSASATNESDFVFTLESDSSVEALDVAVVGVGETLTVSVVIEKNPGMLYGRPVVEFDSSKLKLVDAKAVVNNVKVTDPANVANKVAITIGDFNATVGDPRAITPVTFTGVVAELTFKVLVETDVQTAVTLKASQSYVMNANAKYDSTVSGDVLNVNVVGAEHVCDETKTVEANAVEPTCTEAGKKADLLCAHCGKILVEGEEIPAADHTWGEWVVTTPSTCEAFGVQTRTCDVCGETETDESVPKAAHTFGEWVVKTEPTVDAEGLKVKTCSVCGQEETESIAKLPAPAPAPKNNTLLIVIIVVVVLAGAGVAAYFVLKNKKK